jgi:hypothetical protein
MGGKGGRADDVGEDDRDHLALFAHEPILCGRGDLSHHQACACLAAPIREPVSAISPPHVCQVQVTRSSFADALNC